MEDHLVPASNPRPKIELANEIVDLMGHLNAANRRWLALVAEFDRRDGWSDGATQSCAHWLNWKCGINMGAAREKVRVAHALEKLPKISEAMALGRLSYSKVRAMTRMARPETEDIVLMWGLHGTAAHIERMAAVYRRWEPQEISKEARRHAARSLIYRYDEDGNFVMKGCFPAEVGAVLIKAIEAADGSMFKVVPKTDATEPNEPYAARRADALGKIAESFLQHGAESMTGGDKHQIVVHVSAETLCESKGGRCEFEHGPSMAAETARRLACDASIVTIVENEKGDPLNVGRKTRSIPPSLRRALNSRDKGCRFPGCPNTKFVDAHHIQHWAQGGETKASNLITLCRFHHRKVHEGGITIQTLDDGAVRFTKPDGKAIDSTVNGATPLLSNWTRLPEINKSQGIKIDNKTAATLWLGGTPDYSTGIEGLLCRIRRAKDVSAETPK